MKKTFFNGNELQKEFQEYDRDYYSLDGYEALLMFYDEIDEDMELDVIAICGDCTEYGNYSSCDFQDLINNYEYRAALTMYNKNKIMFVEETGKLLRHADLRSKLLINEAFKGMGKENIYNNNSVKKLNEFLMVMELHQRKGELAEFIPKLTPFLYELLLYYFENHVALKLERFCYRKRNNNSSWKISAEKLRKEAPDVFTYLNYYFRQGFRDTDLSFSNMLLILESLKSVKTELMGELQILREVEKNQRNKIAHTILTDVTEENLQAIEPKLSSYQIIQHLRKAFLLIMEGESICKRNVYDDLNRRIVDSLNEFNK